MTESNDVASSRQVRRILSIDGGGIKGTHPAAFLAALEKDLPEPIGSYFDLIAGTSTGGILAIGLALGLRAETLLNLYVERGPNIFGSAHDAKGKLRAALKSVKQVFAPKHDADVLQSELVAVLGDKKIGDAKTRLLIPAWDADHRSVYIFKTAHHARLKTDYQRSVVDAAMATAAAPTYYRRHRTADFGGLLDGGVWSNNPIALAVVEATTLLGWRDDQLRVLSLGCVNEVYGLPDAPGLVGIGRDFVRLFMDGQSRGALGMAKLLTGHEHEREAIYRICPDVSKGTFALDDTGKIAQLRGMGAAAARKERHRLESAFFFAPVEPFEPHYKLEGK